MPAAAVPADRPAWRTSSHSAGGACVEVAPGPRGVLVRDSKDGGLGPMLQLDHVAWRELLAAAAARRTGAVGGLRITQGARRTRHAGSDLVTTWHVGMVHGSSRRARWLFAHRRRHRGRGTDCAVHASSRTRGRRR